MNENKKKRQRILVRRSLANGKPVVAIIDASANTKGEYTNHFLARL